MQSLWDWSVRAAQLPIIILPGLFLAVMFTPALAQSNSTSHRVLEIQPLVRLETSLGNIIVRLDAAAAPITVSNFLRYVDNHFYDGGRFFRTVTPSNQPTNKVKIEVIQAEANPAREKESFPPIALERTRDTKLNHGDGTLSMARDGPDTAQSSFSICVGDQPELDFGGKRNPDGQGFAAFGHVIEGMDVVRKIHDAPADGQRLKPSIRILRVVRID